MSDILSQDEIDELLNSQRLKENDNEETISELPISEEIIAETTEEIRESIASFDDLVSKTADTAYRLTSIVAETEERSSETVERMIENGNILVEEAEMVIGHRKKYTDNLEASFEKERKITNERIERKFQDIDAEEKIVKREHAITMTKFRNAKLERRVQFGDLKAQLAKLVEEKKNQKATEAEKPRKKDPWDFWWLYSIIVALIILCLATTAINNKWIF